MRRTLYVLLTEYKLMLLAAEELKTSTKEENYWYITVQCH